MKSKMITLGLALAIAPVLSATAGFAVEPGADNQPVMPGTVNYVEGSVSVDGQSVTPQQIGNITLQPGQVLSTQSGKAEVLLTPGVFLRVGSNSAIRLLSPDLANTQVQVVKGRAGVEVDDIQKENNLQIVDGGVTTRLQKTGYYEFDADSPQAMVFNGKAQVELADGKHKEIKGNHQAVLQPGLTSLKTPKIAENRSNDELFNWSRLRSHYLAEANHEIAGDYASDAYAPGWFWNPYGYGYTFLGGGPFMSPFGWGFYPVGWGFGWGGWYGPGFGYGYGPGWYGGGYYYGGGHRSGNGMRRFGETHGGGAPRGSSHSFGATRMPSARMGSMGAGRIGGSMGGSMRMGGGMHTSPHR